ncbi:neuroligin-4, X-linked-like [Uloborus diversus]|uniref:neuroligin-4, X-linked-like n=1 Tax=Uloborus diversus TaxID=327109 RepID=UPI002409A99A|nr:neuroligin-4, X-linked-like [Uloborus diversus]
MWGPVCPQKHPDISDDGEALKRMPHGRLRYLKRLIPHLNHQSEDCLYLNIYAPAVVGRQPLKLPVMVYIHGESYEWNAGNPYDGRVLSSYGNVIVVTINYRLGVLGFLPAMDRLARGNYGLMDQVAALHWIQENILEFGGDSDNVTIFGQGHGAACVNFLMLSPMAKGLFHRAIMQSGSALSPWAIARDAVSHTQRLAEALNCSTQDSMALIECLRRKRLEDIMSINLPVPDHLTGFGPTVDGIVLSHDPLYLMETKPDLFLRYNLLLGTTKVESYFRFSANEEMFGIRTHRRDKILRTLVRNLFNHHLQQIFLTVVNEYMDWSLPLLHTTDIFSGTVSALSDSLVVSPLIRTGMMHSNPKFQPGLKPLFYVQPKTYFYVFVHQTENGDYSPRLGCITGEDIAYVFGAPLVSALSHFGTNYTAEEMALSEITMLHWTSFAKYGDPNVGTQLGDLKMEITRGRYERVIWPEFTSNHQKYLSISLKPRVRDHYNAHKLSYWLRLIPHLDSVDNTTSDRHHLLDDHHNMSSYDGNVRDLYVDVIQSTANDVFSGANITSQDASLDQSKAIPGNSTDIHVFGLDKGAYLSALGVTIAVGCSLLMLNIVAFAAIYYQKDKLNVAKNVQKAFYKVEHGPESEEESSYKKPYLLKDAPSSLILHDFEPLQPFSKEQPIFDLVETNEIKRQLEDSSATELIKSEKPQKVIKTVTFLDAEPLLIEPPEIISSPEPSNRTCHHEHLTFKPPPITESEPDIDS